MSKTQKPKHAECGVKQVDDFLKAIMAKIKESGPTRSIDVSPERERLLKLVRQTKRYSICEFEPGQARVYDDRRLLDRLLAIPELRPRTGDWIQGEFEKALESLSAGPTLTEDDRGMLAWLSTTVEVIDPECNDSVFNTIYEAAVIFTGTLGQVESFISATLDPRA